MNDARCEECGAAVAGFEACQSEFRELNARSAVEPEIGRVWWAIVDAYAMQHVEQYGASAKSYAAHLMGLCCFAEHDARPGAYRAIHLWLDGPARVEKPAALLARGTLTLHDITRDAARVREWVTSVWQACAPQHALARAWLSQALAAPHGQKQKSRHRPR